MIICIYIYMPLYNAQKYVHFYPHYAPIKFPYHPISWSQEMAEPMRQISPKDPGSLERPDPGFSTVLGDCWKWGSWLVTDGEAECFVLTCFDMFCETSAVIQCSSGILRGIWSYVTMMAHETYTEPCKDCLLKTIFKFRLTLVSKGKIVWHWKIHIR